MALVTPLKCWALTHGQLSLRHLAQQADVNRETLRRAAEGETHLSLEQACQVSFLTGLRVSDLPYRSNHTPTEVEIDDTLLSR